MIHLERRRVMERTAVITGASQGLGLALARRLAADGWALAIDARRPDRLAAAADELRERHPGRGDRRRHHRPRPPPAARRRGPPARAGPARRQQRQHARREPAAGARRPSTPTCCAGRSTSTSWPRSRSCQLLAPAPRRRARRSSTSRGRGGRGVPHLGRLRRHARRRSSTPVGCSPSSIPSGGC